MKWKWIILLIAAIAAVALPAGIALADTSAGVVITVSGNVSAILGLPSDFTVTYISDCEIQITWTKGLNATNTLIRSAVGRVPENRYDGRQVYYGNGTWVNDIFCTQVVDKPTYYVAWSESNGTYTGDSTSDDIIGGREVTLLGLFIFCGIMSWISLRSNFFLIKLLAGMAWIAMFLYTKSYPPGAIPEGSSAHVAILMILIGLGIAIPLYGLGREIQKQERGPSGGMESYGGWHMPSWLKGPEEEERTAQTRRESDIEAYRMKMRQAFRGPEKFRRR